jgi:hypothetical protein
MENGCICTTGGVSVRAVGAAASLLCTALVMATDPACAPGAGDCFAANGSPGCADVDCCRTVCACDPFCCSVTWDGYCAGSGYVPGCGALLLCELPLGACCLPDTSCLDVNVNDCAAAGGVFLPGTDCASVVCGSGPANDDCENAAPLDCNTAVTWDNTFATTQAEWEVPLSCYFGAPNLMTGSVWFTIEGTGEEIQLDTCASAGSPDTLIVVYSDGSPLADCAVIGAEVACSEDAGCGPTGLLSRLCFPSTVGVQYLVGVGSFDDASRGEITLTVTCPCPPPPTVDCPKGSTAEGEANCGLPLDTVNGGCNSVPNVFSSISCGETICHVGLRRRDARHGLVPGHRDRADRVHVDGDGLVRCVDRPRADLSAGNGQLR